MLAEQYQILFLFYTLFFLTVTTTNLVALTLEGLLTLANKGLNYYSRLRPALSDKLRRVSCRWPWPKVKIIFAYLWQED